MKLRLYEDPAYQEPEVSIVYAQKDVRVSRIVDFVESVEQRIKCENGSTDIMVNASDIFYCESVKKTTFVHVAGNTYRTDHRLYDLAEKLQDCGFVRVSKSCILNINVLESVKPLFNSRMEAILTTGDRVYINRTYLKNVKQALKGYGA